MHLMEFPMRPLLLCLSALLPLPALAQDDESTSLPAFGTPPGIYFNTSIAVNAPLTATDSAGKLAEEDSYRQSLYVRSVAECEGLMATIAKSCTITGVNVSSQINANPGQPDYLYVTANISMTVELK
jgi:hypothetical protein